MKNIAVLLIIAGLCAMFACSEDSQSETFKLLTGPVWSSDSLLANGIDASGALGLLKNFKGEAKFNEDGTGYFGTYKGTWRFAFNESQVVISSDSLAMDISAKIAELSKSSLKITTYYPNMANPAAPTYLRMTFKPK